VEAEPVKREGAQVERPLGEEARSREGEKSPGRDVTRPRSHLVATAQTRPIASQ
jgi:hypothetical protein